MIVSPCVKCKKRNQPKDKCARYCKILHEIQDYEISVRHRCITSAIDYSDEGRYTINTVEAIPGVYA